MGNKSDLRPDQRTVTLAQGKELAKKYKCAHIETSARHNENVTKAFELVIGQIEGASNPGEVVADAGKCEVM